MVDVIIPIYNARAFLPYVLMSIACQEVTCDFLVTLVDDASSEKYDDIIKKFQDSISIKYLRLDVNSGAGVARQFALDNTKNPYIIFIDVDDLFYNADSIEKLFSNIELGYDVVCGMQYNEIIDAEFINEGDLHGKIYRREFLLKQKIRFNDTRFHEDNYFHNCVMVANAKAYNLEEPVYIYCNNDCSTTKISNSTEFERLPILLSNVKSIIDQYPVTKDNIDRLTDFLLYKYRYYNRIYKKFNISQKKQFTDWLNYYDKDNIDLLGIDDNDDLYNSIYSKLEIKINKVSN